MYRKKTSGLLKHIDFILLDIMCLELSFVAAYVLRHGWTFSNETFEKLYVQVAIFLVVVDILVVVFSNSYKHVLFRGHYVEFMATLKQTTLVTVALVVYLYMSQNAGVYSRTVFLLTWGINLLLSYIVKEIWKYIVRKYMEKSNSETMIVVTVSDECEELMENLMNDKKGKYNIIGLCIIDKDMTGQCINSVPIVACCDKIQKYICRNWIDEVFFSVRSGYNEIENKLVDDCILMGITVHQNILQTINIPGKIQVVEKMNQYTVLTSAINTVTLSEMFFKRAMDIIGSIIGLAITGVLFIFIAPLIYIKSPGPIFFKQWRVGRNGKKFKIYKFRSMYMDAEERKAELMAQNQVKDGMMFKIENDPRIIGGEKGKGIGNFIRNTSIDELPQFLNILKGDMSLVGTRPPTLDEWEKYEMHHRARLAIKPGLTGMWQVSGRSGITDFEEVVKLDTEYIMNWNIGKDIKILLKTIWVVFKRKGSM